MQGQSFDEVHSEVTRRHDRMLPDMTVSTGDLAMDVEGRIVAPGGTTYGMNEWARSQLASKLGIRWGKWFATATPAERAEEVTRRLQRTPGELKIRAWRDDSGTADGVARAFLAPSFTPIDDVRLFDQMHTMVRGVVAEYRFTRVEMTEGTSHYTAVHRDPCDLRGDVLHPGWHLRNSEVGGSALTLDDFWLRLVCTNGLMVQSGGKRALYRTHRAIDDDQLAAALTIALGRLPSRNASTLALMSAAMDVAVPHPDAAVEAILGESADVPKALVEAAQRVVLRDGDRSRFGVVQAITYVAHAENDDPDVRFAMERLAGGYLAAA